MSTLFSHFFTKINQIRPLETDFTEVLNSIALTPKTLYFRGKMPENVSKNGKLTRPKSVAIVGSRRNTRYGEEVAYKMAYELAKRGVVIVSGLAYGIDSVSHRAAVDAGGKTVAVLGTAIDKIYPRNHEKLAAEIVEKGGAVLSEYPPTNSDAPLVTGEFMDKNGQRQINYKGSFLHRNRLISGLSDVVVVVEAAERSGTLNTAAHALNQGKDVFAVPGNLTSQNSVGCNRLIKQGAYPYTGPEDLLDFIFPEEIMKKSRKSPKFTLPQGLNKSETAVLKALFEGLRDGNEIAEKLALPAASLAETLTLLELKGLIRPLGMNNWALV